MTKLLTISELSEATGFSKKTLYAWCKDRKIPHIKIGNDIRFDKDKIENWIANRTVRMKQAV